MCFSAAHMGRAATPTTFADWLGDQLTQRAWGVRTLAKQLNPTHPEIPRRALNRYLHEGAKPTESYRTAIAAAFGLSKDELPDDEGEEPG